MRVVRAIAGIAGMLLVIPGGAHEGALDSYGCHPNVAHGTYHCHKGPLAGRQYPSKERMVRAYKEQQRSQRPKPTLPAPRY